MAAIQRATVNTEVITERFYVRESLNDDHVIHLASLIEGGTKLPPIRVTEGHELIDGRHRLAAVKMLGRNTIEVAYENENDPARLIAQALRANLGGALPPTNGDISYALRQMLEAGMTGAAIQREFSQVWPPAVVRSYLETARSALNNDKVRKAKAAVLDRDMTINEAAAEYGVDVTTLKNAISPGGRKKRTGAREFKSNLTNIFRSRGASMSMTMRKVKRQLEDGDLSWSAVEDILEHLDRCAHATTNSAKEWVARLKAVKP